ncbi:MULTISPECIES: hypothetical protein [unclassified Coleofasciculus]|uniref:hypothetical protein n=1 Tax=unclassified Coleofasciculus TaxID=2692782 RepID=UPI001880DF36|nr:MULTISPECIES: hypothetical protein [unclassified Coleofasciculus]MBE9127605.1 hypothetical protein [Coleofasciculus sp. LEGE 07081]MBE9150924.1 hypothetical protein [Coleofasciculus sp. LEGE 07092]
MKARALLGYIASLTLWGSVLLLATVIAPISAVAEETSAIRKVVLLDLLERGGVSAIAAEVTTITWVDSYALANWFWGQSEGETVLINENEQWRVIVTSRGTLAPSTLVQYGIPRDMARTLVSRARGAPAEQPPVANLFAEQLPQLQQQTDVPIFLPSELPPFKQQIYVNSYAGRNAYSIALRLQQNCDGIPACTLGSFSAKPVDSAYSPVDWLTQEILLAKGIQGYFTPSRCNSFCLPSTLEWVWKGMTYRIELKGIGRNVTEEEAVMSAIANSAIEAGAR